MLTYLWLIKTNYYFADLEVEWRMERMPLTMARAGDTISIKKIGGKDDVRRFLESLGFVAGSFVTLIAANQGNVIVNVKDSRVAISKEMANKIFI